MSTNSKLADKLFTNIDILDKNEVELVPVGVVLLGALRFSLNRAGELSITRNEKSRVIEHEGARSVDEKTALQFINKYVKSHDGEYPSVAAIKRTLPSCNSYFARKYIKVAKREAA